jgi:antitoxin component YwqK of YwqJK toxin-antitoxin module
MLKSIICLLIGSFVCCAASFSQCKTFTLSDRGDTLNCVDRNNKKQGPWLVKVPELRGNPGYEEEGIFIDDKKTGIWRMYTLQGDLMAVEKYSWGLKNGKCQYYSLQGLEREESWWAIDPIKPYDTFDVPDLYEDGKYKQVILKNEGRSMKHGAWTWYDTQTGFVQRTEEFIRDSAVSPLAAFGISNKKKREPSDTGTTAKKPAKPSVVEEWEKKNAGKKKIKIRDGSTGN